MSNGKLLFLIFCTFFKISLFVVGGGLAMLPVIEEVFARQKKLLKEEDILDMVTMTQTVPGLIAINAAIFVGNKLMGWRGSVVAVIGTLIPSITIIMLIATFFSLSEVENPHLLTAFSCVRACITGVFLTTAYRLGKKIIHNFMDVLIILCFIVALGAGVRSVYLILAAIPIGWGYILLDKRKQKKSFQNEASLMDVSSKGGKNA